jgi:hypothetical protein
MATSRLQLIAELQRLDREHIAAAQSGIACAALDELLERYSYSELQIVADFLAADSARLRQDQASD